MTLNSRLLTPPQEEEEIRPYRPVWRSIATEAGILFAIVIAFYVASRFLGITFPPARFTEIHMLLALIPAVLWLIFSWSRERYAPQPRQFLLAVAIVSGLVANAVATPLIDNVLRVDEWLPLSSAIDRIIGYTFTVGIVHQTLKYAVLRFMVWPDYFRTRLDGVAYGAASAVGVATVIGLQDAFTHPSSPEIAAITVFSTLALHLATNFILGYGLAETLFSTPSPLLLTITVALAAIITGLALPLGAGLMNADFTLGIGADKPLQGLLFSAALLTAISIVMAFLFDIADRREREAAASREP